MDVIGILQGFYVALTRVQSRVSAISTPSSARSMLCWTTCSGYEQGSIPTKARPLFPTCNGTVASKASVVRTFGRSNSLACNVGNRSLLTMAFGGLEAKRLEYPVHNSTRPSD